MARHAVGYAAGTLPLLRLLDVVTWDPDWGGYAGPAWWPTLVHDEQLNLWVYRLEMVNVAVVAAFLLVLALLRLCRAARIERRTLVPVVIAAAFFGGAAATDAVATVVDSTTPVSVVLSNLAFLALPLSLLVSLAVRRFQRALAVEALLQPQRLPDPNRSARHWQQRWVIVDSRSRCGRRIGTASLRRTATRSSGTSTTRTQVDLSSSTGAPVARLGIDPRLADETDLVESVSRAAGLALDNARLQVELRARQRATDESSIRLHEAQDMERSLVRLVPGGLVERLRADPTAVTRTERLTVTVLMSDVRGYSGIAERSLPAELADQLNEHRQAMNEVVLGGGGTVMQYVGDAVLAVFGAPEPQSDHAGRALRAALGMQHAQLRLDADWTRRGLEPFGLGIGLCTGEVAAAFLGGAERLEYTVVGDTVNLAARLCDLARPAGTTVAWPRRWRGPRGHGRWNRCPRCRSRVGWRPCRPTGSPRRVEQRHGPSRPLAPLVGARRCGERLQHCSTWKGVRSRTRAACPAITGVTKVLPMAVIVPQSSQATSTSTPAAPNSTGGCGLNEKPEPGLRPGGHRADRRGQRRIALRRGVVDRWTSSPRRK